MRISARRQHYLTIRLYRAALWQHDLTGTTIITREPLSFQTPCGHPGIRSIRAPVREYNVWHDRGVTSVTSKQKEVWNTRPYLETAHLSIMNLLNMGDLQVRRSLSVISMHLLRKKAPHAYVDKVRVGQKTILPRTTGELDEYYGHSISPEPSLQRRPTSSKIAM